MAKKPVGKRRRIGASEFKARCLELLDTVQRTGEELEITKRGTPVAVLLPVRPVRKPLLGSMRGQIEIIGDIVDFDMSDDWEALK